MRARRGILVAGFVGLAVVLGLWATTTLAKEAASKTPSGKEPSLAQVEDKLDQILANQQTILGRFDAVMEELRIVKVRATLRGGGS